jgi:transcriptional regulator with XRE-family HTH domain
MPKSDWSLDQPLANIGPALQALRARRGLGRREIAKLAACSVSVVGRIERGEQRPSLPRLEALLRALGFHLGDLFVEQIGAAGATAPPIPRSDELRAQLDALRTQVDNLLAVFDDDRAPVLRSAIPADHEGGRDQKAAEITRRLQVQHDFLSIEPATAGLWEPSLWEPGAAKTSRAVAEQSAQRGRKSSR